jgi:ribose transport system permease protein
MTPTPPPIETGLLSEPSTRRRLLRYLAEYLGLTIVLLAMGTFFSFATPTFLNPARFTSLAAQIPIETLLAIGMTFVLLVGGIDLSVGAVLAFSGAVAGWLMTQWHLPMYPALLACLATGALCGLVNGLVTVIWGIPSFIVTLGMFEIARGGTQVLANPSISLVDTPIGDIFFWSIMGISVTAYVAVLLVLVAQGAVSYTPWGRYLIATGTNEEALRLSGIRPAPMKLSVFVLSGICAALASIVAMSRAEAALPNAGAGAELQAIAAAVIGGTSLMGGRGSVIGSLFGVVITAVLSAGLVAMDVRDPTKHIVTGCVIVLAVIMDHYRRRLARPV